MLSRLTSKERLWVWSATALGVLLRLAPALRTPARLATRPYIEDAFYAFTVARHLALGHGFTVDGVHPTNGVQPLICLLYAPFFWLTGDRWSGLALTFILQAAVQLVSTILLVALVMRLADRSPSERGEHTSRGTAAVAAALTWNSSMQIFVHNTNGLETGLVALLLLAITYQLTFAISWSRVAVIGVLCGLAVLARIDTAVFVAAVCLWMLRERRFVQAFVAGALAVAVSLPWWIFGLRTFGSIMPISGQSESAHALQFSTIVNNVWEALIAISDIVSVFFYHQRGAIPEWANALWIVAMLAVAVYLVRKIQPFAIIRRTRALQPLLWFAAFVAVYYTFFFGAPHFLARYLHPLRLLWVILMCVAIPKLLENRALVKRASVVIVLVLLFTGQRYLTNFITTDISDLYTAGLWSLDHRNDVVGMQQSGTAGFVADNVVNLDGKVNAIALHAMTVGHDSLGRYVGLHMGYLADWPELIAPVIASAEREGYSFTLIDTLGRVIVYRRTQASPHPVMLR